LRAAYHHWIDQVSINFPSGGAHAFLAAGIARMSFQSQSSRHVIGLSQANERTGVHAMRWCQAVAIFTLAGLVGCGGTEEDSYKLVRVSGTITKNGKPLAGAKVMFVPEASNKISTPGLDETGPEGNYLLNFKGRTGIVAGKYKVTVEAPFEIAGAQAPEELKKDAAGTMMLKFAQQARTVGRKEQETKKEVFKGEFEAEVPDATSFERDFDVKASAAPAATAKQ
jgi:hypothetical protein